MSTKIIARQNSVVNSSILKTMIPSDLHLTSDQIRELSQLESTGGTSFQDSVKIMTSENPGIHFYALENSLFSTLAANPNVSEFIASMLIFRVTSTDANAAPTRLGNLVTKLSTNPVYIGKIDTLTKIISWLKKVSSTTSAANNHLLSFFARITNDIDSFGVEEVMLLADEWNKIPTKLIQTNPQVRTRFRTWILANNEVFSDWLKVNHPDFKDLPVSWVFQIWGLDEDSDTNYPTFS